MNTFLFIHITPEFSGPDREADGVRWNDGLNGAASAAGFS